MLCAVLCEGALVSRTPLGGPSQHPNHACTHTPVVQSLGTEGIKHIQCVPHQKDQDPQGHQHRPLLLQRSKTFMWKAVPRKGPKAEHSRMSPPRFRASRRVLAPFVEPEAWPSGRGQSYGGVSKNSLEGRQTVCSYRDIPQPEVLDGAESTPGHLSWDLGFWLPWAPQHEYRLWASQSWELDCP